MTQLPVLPRQPAIPGLTYRNLDGAEDPEALHAVHCERLHHDRVDPLSTLEDFPSLDWLQTTISQANAEGQHANWLVAQIGSQVIGYSHLLWWPEDDGTWVYLTLGWVLPAWRGRGIGGAMLQWAEERIRQLAATHQPSVAFEFAANASSTEREATALLLEAGYRAGFTMVEMGLDASVPIPHHALPSALALRPVHPGHFSAIAASIQEAYQDEAEGGRFDEGFNPGAYVRMLGEPRHDPTLWQVAWHGDQVVGQALSVVERGRAEVFEVSVRPAWRRRGVARALLSGALHTLRARQIGVIRLHTNLDFKTKAADLYHSVGFRVLKEFPRYRKPCTLSQSMAERTT